MGPKIDVIERVKKNSTFRVHLNKAQATLSYQLRFRIRLNSVHSLRGGPLLPVMGTLKDTLKL
jgi:hypothetical protein